MLQKIFKQQDKEKIIKELVADDLGKINKILKTSLNQDEPLIRDIGNHIIGAGGKRVRPILSLLVGYAFNFKNPKLLHLGAAIELIHTATLLHDDVVDESSVRRGRKTANDLHDNKAAILVGDYIFATSFEQMVQTDSLVVMDILAKASKIIAQGEIIQLKSLGSQNFTAENYFTIIEAKTAELFAAATYSAAYMATENRETALEFKDFGKNLGIAFQIIDDLIDYEGNSKIIGKNPGDDFYEGKITLPLIRLHTLATKAETQFIEKLINQDTRSKKDFAEIIKLFDKYDINNKIRIEANSFLTNCRSAIEKFNQDTSYLHYIIDLTAERIK